MQKFKIEVLSKKAKKRVDALGYWGRITIGNFIEKFDMPIDSWTIEEYKQQWKDGLERIKNHSSSCLVYGVQGLHSNKPLLIEIWTLFNEDDTIFIHDEILNTSIEHEIQFPSFLSQFNAQTCYSFVAPYRKINEKGEAISKQGNKKISEWSISVADFFASIKRRK